VVPALDRPGVIAAGLAVGLLSSVVPYALDQVVMARMGRSAFALLLALLPATATAVGLVALGQVPTAAEAAGIGLVVLGVAARTR
jgi:inner membrane transporter RhtA